MDATNAALLKKTKECFQTRCELEIAAQQYEAATRSLQLNSGLVGELQSSLGELQQTADAKEGRIQQLEQQTTQLQKHLEHTQKKVATLDDNLDTVLAERESLVLQQTSCHLPRAWMLLQARMLVASLKSELDTKCWAAVTAETKWAQLLAAVASLTEQTRTMAAAAEVKDQELLRAHTKITQLEDVGQQCQASNQQLAEQLAAVNAELVTVQQAADITSSALEEARATVDATKLDLQSTKQKWQEDTVALTKKVAEGEDNIMSAIKQGAKLMHSLQAEQQEKSELSAKLDLVEAELASMTSNRLKSDCLCAELEALIEERDQVLESLKEAAVKAAAEAEQRLKTAVAAKEAELDATKQAKQVADEDAKQRLKASIATSEGEVETMKEWMKDRLDAVTTTVAERDAEIAMLKQTLQTERNFKDKSDTRAAETQEQLQGQVAGLSKNYKALGAQLIELEQKSEHEKSTLSAELQQMEADLANSTAARKRSEQEHAVAVAGMQAMIADKAARMAAFQEEAAVQEAVVAQLEAEMTALREASSSEAHKLAEGLRDAVSDANEKMAKIQRELDLAHKDKQVTEQQLKDTAATLALSRESDKSKREQLEIASSKNTELEEMVEDRDAILAQTNKELTAAQQRLQQTQALKETSEASADERQQKIVHLEAQITELQTRIKDLEEELAVTTADKEWYTEAFQKSQGELTAALAGRHPKQVRKGFGSSTPTHRSGSSLGEMELSLGAFRAMAMRRRASTPDMSTPMSPRTPITINTALSSPHASMTKSKSSTSLRTLNSPTGDTPSTFATPSSQPRPSRCSLPARPTSSSRRRSVGSTPSPTQRKRPGFCDAEENAEKAYFEVHNDGAAAEQVDEMTLSE